MRIGGLRDGLSIRNFRRMENHVHAIFLLESRNVDLDVELSLTAEQELFRLRFTRVAEAEIFIHQFMNRGADLFFVAARLRLDSK